MALTGEWLGLDGECMVSADSRHPRRENSQTNFSGLKKGVKPRTIIQIILFNKGAARKKNLADAISALYCFKNIYIYTFKKKNLHYIYVR